MDLGVVDKNPGTVSETDSSYTLKSAEIILVLNKKNGFIQSVRNTANDYQLSFNNGPVPAEGMATVDSSRTYKAGNNTVVEFSYSGTLKIVRWLINASGWVTMEYEYKLDGVKPFTGVIFNYPENYVLGAKWLGKGPTRQWKNRMAGTSINVWQDLYNNTHTGYPPIQYPQCKGYFGEIIWMELSTVQGNFYVATRDRGLFVRLFDFYGLSSDNKPYPELPAGNISFLDFI